MVGPHDIGGKDFGPINLEPHQRTAFDKKVDGLQKLLGAGGLRIYKIDELRRMIEQLNPKDYNSLGYYQRWIIAIEKLIVDKGVLLQDEINDKLNEYKRDN